MTFNTHTKQLKIKEVSKENHLLASITNELSYETHFFQFGYIVSPAASKDTRRRFFSRLVKVARIRINEYNKYILMIKEFRRNGCRI